MQEKSVNEGMTFITSLLRSIERREDPVPALQLKSCPTPLISRSDPCDMKDEYGSACQRNIATIDVGRIFCPDQDHKSTGSNIKSSTEVGHNLRIGVFPNRNHRAAPTPSLASYHVLEGPLADASDRKNADNVGQSQDQASMGRTLRSDRSDRSFYPHPGKQAAVRMRMKSMPPPKMQRATKEWREKCFAEYLDMLVEKYYLDEGLKIRLQRLKNASVGSDENRFRKCFKGVQAYRKANAWRLYKRAVKEDEGYCSQ